MSIKIYWPDGHAPYTSQVFLAEAASHIAADDRYADEAQVLIALADDPEMELPDGYEMADEELCGCGNVAIYTDGTCDECAPE